MKTTYWSCSKVADWIRGTKKPESGTSEEWCLWEKSARKKPFRFWLAENGLDFLQDILFWPSNRIKAVRIYIHNRWFIKSHALTSKLERGQWHDFDSRLLHAAFDELINFVEIEQAWMEIISSKDNCKKYNLPFYRRLFRIGAWRNPEAGIAYLKWAAELKIDEDWIDQESPDFGKPTPQAVAAKETLLLYHWWKNDRPQRPDPHDASGWTQYCEKTHSNSEDDFGHLFADKDKEEAKKILALCQKIEMEQDEEDTTMLIRLVKLRHFLWT